MDFGSPPFVGKEPKVLRAKDSFAGTYEGRTFIVAKGQTIDEDHPVARDNPEMFAEVGADIRYVPRTEQATAAPNELRHVVPAPVVNNDLSAMSPTPSEEEETAEEETEPELVNVEDYTYPELKSLASKEGVAITGTAAQLVERINAKRLANKG